MMLKAGISFLLFLFINQSALAVPFAKHEQSVLAERGFSDIQITFLEHTEFTYESILARLNQGFTATDIINAITVNDLHNDVEIAAYRALQECIAQNRICCDTISRPMSRTLLNACRNGAHRVMRSPTGYVTRRGQFLAPHQFQPILQRVGEIIHDRDGRLTNAEYDSLCELVRNLDEHNCFVNDILYNAWGLPMVGMDHIAFIKSQSGFVGLGGGSPGALVPFSPTVPSPHLVGITGSGSQDLFSGGGESSSRSNQPRQQQGLFWARPLLLPSIVFISLVLIWSLILNNSRTT